MEQYYAMIHVQRIMHTKRRLQPMNAAGTLAPMVEQVRIGHGQQVVYM